ncbi:MAG: prolyl oligopeptidase family serine peptidase [Candidatus Paceibacterota bacterium]|jgi:esterase/lipase
MHIFRTRFKKDIVCEFLPPNKDTGKVVIFCGGLPSFPSKPEVLKFFAQKGFWVFSPRYRGTWESDGSFLKKSPHQDILDIIDELPKGFLDLFNNKKYVINVKKIYVIGVSFGGPAAILSSLDKRVSKIVALSPVIDWKKEKDMYFIEKFIRSAFGKAYRFSHKDYIRLEKGLMYNPIDKVREINGDKILVIQALDDKAIFVPSVKKFALETKCKTFYVKKGGHFSSSILSNPHYFKKFKEFIKR